MDTKLLRQKILDLAIRGKLVPQDPNDEPASVLLERIKTEKERLIKEGKIKRSKKTASTSDSRHYENAPFEIPNTWAWCKLEDIAQSNIGLTYKPANITDNGTPVYRSNNIKDRKINATSLIRVNTDILDNQYLNIGDLLICARNGSRRLVGKCAIIESLNEPTSFGAFMAVCRSEYNPWIFTILNTSYFDKYLDDSNSTAINQVTQKMLLALPIPFPPLSEQKRIVSAIEKWFAIIDKTEEYKANLQTAVEQTKSKIIDLAIHGKLVPQDSADEPASELLRRVNPSAEITCDNEQNRKLPSNWCLTNLGSIGKWKSGATPSRIVKEYYGGQIPWLKTGDLNDDFITYIPEHITQKALDETSVYLNPTGSVLIAMYGATIGKVGILTFPATTNQACCACSEYFVNKMYLFYFLIANRTAFIASGGGGAQSNISKEKIVKTTFPLPPLAEQQRIVDRIKELYEAINLIESSLQA